MSQTHVVLIKKYLQLPERLEAAITGLSESNLDLRAEGWSIREYVHHTVEGELLWQVNLRAILGTDGIEFPFQWYFTLSQDEWAQCWASDKRAIEPTLALFRASTRSLAELLHYVDPQAWKHHGLVTWPGAKEITRLTVREILLIHIGHMDQHTRDIRAIRELHNC
jgi:DinB superfamily